MAIITIKLKVNDYVNMFTVDHVIKTIDQMGLGTNELTIWVGSEKVVDWREKKVQEDASELLSLIRILVAPHNDEDDEEQEDESE